MSKKTVLTFDQVGGIKVDATGFVGTACAETTAKILAGIGSETVEENKKAEYARTGMVATTDTVGQRW